MQLHSLVLFSTFALIALTSPWQGVSAADARKNRTESSEKKTRPTKGEKGQKRRESAALKEIREDLEKTRHELEKTRDTLHEAHKELGSKAETISSLEARLASVTVQLEKTREEGKKSNTAARTVEKQSEELEAVRKKLAELQNKSKAIEKPAAAALAEAKKPTPENKPEKSPTSEPGSAKARAIAPIFYEAASAVNYPERDRALKQVAEALRKSPKARVEITGHADDSKYEQTNVDVSTNRAKFLAAYFVLNGIPKEKVVVTGLGNTSPLESESNRRVEISIVD